MNISRHQRLVLVGMGCAGLITVQGEEEAVTAG